ncbi:hypothetical protein KJ762_15205 [bacterium]|nr:hypothetical protein [bacterium]MBU1872565.1 hypothetical protein [bacterium]
MKYLYGFILVFSIILHTTFATNLPRAREATLIEVSSPTEVLIKAAGLGIDKKHSKPKAAVLDQSANDDAAKTAVWFVLIGGSDPLIQTEKEKVAFQKIEEAFFGIDNIRKFISWEADYYDKRLKTDGGKSLKIEKSFKINKALLEEYLVNKSVFQKFTNISASVGMPTIMVIPESNNDIAPLDLLTQNPDIKKGAEVIEAYLSAKQFSVVVPEQQQVLQELSSTQFALGGSDDDYSYLLALSIGSDVYVSYNISISTRIVGTSDVKKAVVGCRAYETTTGRLLGTETGYSQERPSATNAALIEEAMSDAVDKVISRIINYWKTDLKLGIQYKCIINVSNVFDSEQAEEIIFAVGDACKSVASLLKENTVADHTYDISLWVNPEKYPAVSDIYRAIKASYTGEGIVKRVSISRKLILLSVEEE